MRPLSMRPLSMRPPVIVVTGAIASGKTLVATVLADRGGTLVDCDSLARRVYDNDELLRRLVEVFGDGILTPSGRVSRVRLAKKVFSDESLLERLNELVRPFVTRIINETMRRLRTETRYIVLDAVLFFQYKFRFKVDLVVLAEASVETRLRRMMRRDGFSRKEALMRIERQTPLEREWAKADVTVRTDVPKKRVIAAAVDIRDRFIARHL